MTDRLEFKAEVSLDDAGSVNGIAWPFGSPDRVGDTIRRGAFKFAKAVPMVMEHDQKQVVGVWETYAETDKGLEVKGRLFVEGIGPARDAYRHLKARVVEGLSVSWRNGLYERRPDGGREFTDITIDEISLCRRPVHPGARITAVKAISEDDNMEPAVNTENTEPAMVEKKAFDALQARLDKLEAKANRLPASNDNQANDNLETKAFENFLRYGVQRIGADEQKALVVSNDGAAGYLAPTEYGSEILKKLVEWSPVRQFARVVTIGGKEIKYPRKLTGAAAVWTDEAAPSTASSMTFEQITLRPYTMRTYTDVSHEMLEDNAYDLRGELIADYSEAFGKTEASAFVTGDGVGKPKGIMTATGLAEIKTGAAANLGTDPAATIIGMYHALPQAHAQNAVWMMNRKTLAALRVLKDGNGRFILVDPISAGMPTTLLGRPIVEAIDMDDVGANKFPILFGDLQGYRIVQRLDLNVFPDPYTLAANGQIRFNARARVGADVTHPDRFVKLKVAA